MQKALFGALALVFGLSAASAEAGNVYVNGKRLNRTEIAWLANYSCGPIPAGNYWINLTSGYWGYVGSTRIMGHVRDRCGQRRVFKDGNMSREGRLYYPGELLR